LVKYKSNLGSYKPCATPTIIYEIISKLIASKHKLILLLIISQEQGGFVEGRKILDGIVVSHEVVHSLKISKKVGIMMKLDISKA